MLKGPKKKIGQWEEKILIMPSTKTGSSFINSTAKLITFALVIFGLAGMAAWSLFTGAFLMALYYTLGYLAIGRGVTFLTRTTKKRKGYVQVDRKTAFELLDVERAYERLSPVDRETYKGYFEGAFYGEATPSKVVELFNSRVNNTPKVLDELIDMELPKD